MVCTTSLRCVCLLLADQVPTCRWGHRFTHAAPQSCCQGDHGAIGAVSNAAFFEYQLTSTLLWPSRSLTLSFARARGGFTNSSPSGSYSRSLGWLNSTLPMFSAPCFLMYSTTALICSGERFKMPQAIVHACSTCAPSRPASSSVSSCSQRQTRSAAHTVDAQQ